MKYSVSAFLLGFLTALSAAAPTPNTDGLDPSQVSIRALTYAGTGCPAGSTTFTHSPDFQTFTVIFDNYKLSIGPGTKISDHSKKCNLNVQIRYPPDYQYTLYKVDYTGYARLDRGVTAKLQTSYWFPIPPNSMGTFHSSLPGPYDNSYTLTDTLASENTIWSPCGASITLKIDTQIVLTSSNSNLQGQIDPDIIDPRVITRDQHKYSINWRKCH